MSDLEEWQRELISPEISLLNSLTGEPSSTIVAKISSMLSPIAKILLKERKL